MVEERTRELQARQDALEHQAVELAEARVQAEVLAQAKSDFLANMSHEIRTPLNGVVAAVDMLARSGLPSRERNMAELIRASGDTLQRLLSDILDMARIESGQIAVEVAPFHVGDMVRAVAGLSQLKCDEKGVALHLEIGSDLDEVVTGDAVRVRQVITNLLSNAVKFTDKGEVRLRAERLADGRARFTVSDTGRGLLHGRQGQGAQPLRAGRQLDHAALRRNRARSVDLLQSRRAHGRFAGLRQPAGRRLDVLDGVAPRAGLAGPRASGDAQGGERPR